VRATAAEMERVACTGGLVRTHGCIDSKRVTGSAREHGVTSVRHKTE
jgi:hypothetical protein